MTQAVTYEHDRRTWSRCPTDEAEWRFAGRNDVGMIRARYVRQSFPRHTHETFVIGVNERGAHRSWYRGSIVVIPELTVVVVPPGEVHTGEPVPNSPWEYRAIYPDSSLLRDVASELGHRQSEIPLFPSLVLDDRELALAFLGLHRQCESFKGDALACEGAVIQMLMALIRRHADGPVGAPMKACTSAVSIASEYMRANYAKRITLELLADEAGVSRYTIFRVFRRELGISPYAFLTQIRVEEARRLIAAGTTIATASHDAGFADQSHLNRHFKRLTGVTPGAFARGVRKSS